MLGGVGVPAKVRSLWFFKAILVAAFSNTSASRRLAFSRRAPSLYLFCDACSLAIVSCYRSNFNGSRTCLSSVSLLHALPLGPVWGVVALSCFYYSFCASGGSWSGSCMPSSYAYTMSSGAIMVVAKTILSLGCLCVTLLGCIKEAGCWRLDG